MSFKKPAQVSPMHPVCGPSSDVKAEPSCANRVFVAFCRLAASYNTMQVSHRGTYSVERLQAFKSYCERTSVARVVAVCLLTPLPALLVTVLLDCIPLRNPEEGWEANYMFWIRFFVSGVIINVGLTYQVQNMVNDLDLSAVRVLGIAVMCIGVYVSTVMLVASQWVFPVPFGIILGVGPCFIIYLWVLYLTIGPNQLRTNPTLTNDLKQQLYVVGIQAILITIYPAFNALYFDVNPHQRVGLVLILPFTKFIMKNIVAWSCSHLEEYVPVIEVFSVEVFNALYVSTCMQAVNSEFATLVVIALDAVHGALAIRTVRQMTRFVHQQQPVLIHQPAGESNDIVTTALTTALHLRVFRTQAGKLIRVRSPLKRSGNGIQNRQLERIATRQQTFAQLEAQKPTAESITSIRSTSEVSRIQSKLERASSGRVGPSPLLVVLNKKQLSFEQLSHEALQAEVVESSLRLLFRCEYIALVEYVECAVPLLFGIYLSILTGLSSREYYPQTRDMLPGQLERTLTNLCMYVTLELASFLIIHTVVKQRVGLSALYQVAFVLETQVIQLQSRLFVWIIFILQFTLQHYGVDFTFRFTWMK